MLFSRVLFALPFLASTFAAPTRRAVAAVSVDVHAIALDLKVAIAAPCAAIRAQVDVAAVVVDNLGLINTALIAAQASLSAGGVDLNALAVASVKRDVVERELVDDVAETLAEVVREVIELVDALPADILSLPVVATLLSQIDIAITLVLQGVEFVLAGVLFLVAGLLADVKGLLNGLLGGLLGGLGLGPLLGGVTGLLGL